MADLIKSGDFAKLCNTTKNTLIHYDELGLLLPASVDKNTGYRYYTYSQQQRFASIRALSNAGFSLQDVARLLNERDFRMLSDAVEEGRRSLRARITELEDSLTQLRAMQEQLYLAMDAPLDEPQVIELSDRYYVVAYETDQPREVVDMTEDSQVQACSANVMKRLAETSPSAAMAEYGLVSSGPIGEGPVRYSSFGYFIPSPNDARLLGGTMLIPGGRFVQLAFDLPWEDISPAHRTLVEFVRQHGGNPNAPRYEVSAFRLFDSSSTEGFDRYRGILYMPLQADGTSS